MIRCTVEHHSKRLAMTKISSVDKYTIIFTLDGIVEITKNSVFRFIMHLWCLRRAVFRGKLTHLLGKIFQFPA